MAVTRGAHTDSNEVPQRLRAAGTEAASSNKTTWPSIAERYHIYLGDAIYVQCGDLTPSRFDKPSPAQIDSHPPASIGPHVLINETKVNPKSKSTRFNDLTMAILHL